MDYAFDVRPASVARVRRVVTIEGDDSLEPAGFRVMATA
jgi:hypothetical protein